MSETGGKITVVIDSALEELIPDFMELTRKDIDNMQDALDKEDYETVQRFGHSFKGCGSGYGFHRISEIGAEVEKIAGEKAREKIQKFINELSDYLDRLEIVYE